MGSVLLVVVTVLLTLFFERLVPSWWHSWQRRRRERLEAERTAEMRRIDQSTGTGATATCTARATSSLLERASMRSNSCVSSAATTKS